MDIGRLRRLGAILSRARDLRAAQGVDAAEDWHESLCSRWRDPSLSLRPSGPGNIFLPAPHLAPPTKRGLALLGSFH